MPSWSIRKKSEACTACAREYVDGEALFSLLQAGEEGLARVDLCQSCFQARPDEDAAKDLFFWKTRFQPQAKKGLAVDFDAVEGLFLALEGREETRLAELRYLLALLLMRKKRLKLVRILRRTDAEGMVMRRPRRDEALEVLVFDLTPERMDAPRADLARIFEGAGAEEILAQPAAEAASEATASPEEPGQDQPDEPDEPGSSEDPDTAAAAEPVPAASDGGSTEGPRES